jgi:ABC-type phosphate transport system substrate-binding protein
MGPFTLIFERGILLLVAGLCLAMFSPAVGVASDGDVAVVVHPGVPVDNLSLAEVRKILLGERQYWSSDLRVTLLIRAPVARERDVVLKILYVMTEAQFRQYWIAKVFRAEIPAGPKIVYSNEMATELVASIPGSIAFVSAAQVPKGLKVLKVDGHLPGEEGYPLR